MDVILSFAVVRRRRDRESLKSIIELLPEAEDVRVCLKGRVSM